MAWICANTPQGAIAVAMVWASEARTFTHQERLVSGVAELLTGEVVAPGILAKADELPTRSSPATPAVESPWKLQPMQVERGAELVIVRPRVARGAIENWTLAERLKSAPPHGPPRVG